MAEPARRHEGPGTAATRRRTAAAVAALLLGTLAASLIPADAAAAGQGRKGTAAARQEAADGSPLPASSAMALGDWRLPPPGYLDYCLRHAGRDAGCRR